MIVICLNKDLNLEANLACRFKSRAPVLGFSKSIADLRFAPIVLHCVYTSSPFFWVLRLEMKVIKSSGGIPRLSYTGRDDRHFVPTGLYIVRTVSGRSSMIKHKVGACVFCMVWWWSLAYR